MRDSITHSRRLLVAVEAGVDVAQYPTWTLSVIKVDMFLRETVS